MMSTEHDALLGIGRRFSNDKDAAHFIAGNTNLTEEQIARMFEGGTHLGMSVECLDCYGGADWFVGFEVGGDVPDVLIGNVVDAHERWDAIFKDVAPRVIHAVRVY
jgi:hypothetical protein